MAIVYLAGLISTKKKQSLEWRHEATLRLRMAGFTPLSPVRGKDLSYSKDGGVTVDADVTGAQQTAKACVSRDYHDVLRSDVILANLNTWGSKRPLVGTLMELAWAWLLKKPVVAVCDESDYLMKHHPFIQDAVTQYFSNVEEAIEFIRRYYA